MDKLKMHTPNKADENFHKLAALFPDAVTETINENGEVVRAIDKDVLMQEISTTVVEGKDERYQFTWPDKKKSVLLANAPISKTLRPCREESMGKDGTPGGFDSENLYIEGDNLEVLKLLQETYLGKVKMIYIDPPYNTGNDFVYEDDFAQSADEYLANSGQFDEEGNRLVTNTESNGRFHSDWLNMIYPRLKLAKDLLAEDGVIFISIDDGECANLIKVCNNVFGEDCFVADISWQKTYAPRNDSKGIVSEVEHIIVYGKCIDWTPSKLPRTDEMNLRYNNPDNDIKPWKSSDAFAPGASTHQGMVYAVQNPFTGKLIYPAIGRHWSLSQEQIIGVMQGWSKYELKTIDDAENRARICGILKDEVRKDVKAVMLSVPLEESATLARKVYDRGQWPRFFFTKEGQGGIARKIYLEDVGGRLPTNFWPHTETGHTDEAKKEVKALFDGAAPFDTPKPVRLIDRMLTIATDKESLVLDFFSGSATTAHAVMKKNAEDGGKRKFIMVQLPEKSASPQYGTLCDVGKERIRRAGAKIKEENPMGTMDLDVGFRVLKCDTSNMKDVYYTPDELDASMFDLLTDNIKEDRTPEDLLFQVMLDLGVLLSSKIEETVIAGKKVFKVEDNFLVACFDRDVTNEVIEAIAREKPIYFVMRDSSLANDSVATNFDQIFATYSPETIRKVL